MNRRISRAEARADREARRRRDARKGWLLILSPAIVVLVMVVWTQWEQAHPTEYKEPPLPKCQQGDGIYHPRWDDLSGTELCR